MSTSKNIPDSRFTEGEAEKLIAQFGRTSERSIANVEKHLRGQKEKFMAFTKSRDQHKSRGPNMSL